MQKILGHFDLLELIVRITRSALTNRHEVAQILSTYRHPLLYRLRLRVTALVTPLLL